MTDVPICVDCKYYHKPSWWDQFCNDPHMRRPSKVVECRHPASQYTRMQDVVTGERSPEVWQFCRSMRDVFGRCGEGGDLFEPRARS